MRLSINRARAIIFLVAAFGYLPLQSADQSSLEKNLKVDSKIEKVKSAPEAQIPTRS